MKFLFFIIIQVFLCSLANADRLETATLQGNSNRHAGIIINVWRGAHSGLTLFEINRKNYVKDEVISVLASITTTSTTREILGETTPMYVVAVVNGTAYTKNANGQWLRWDGRLQAFEIQDTSGNQLYPVNLIDGLTGLTGTIDVYFGFGTKTGDVIYNKKPLTIQISEGYEHILTVGENGTYAGCDGIKTALNIAQDSTEIRIQQGIYPCSGIEIASSKNFNKYGIKISGGWDNGFQVQSNDPSLTILDGANNEGTILDVENFGAISVEMISFQNAIASNEGSFRGPAISGDALHSKVFINKCHFRKNGRRVISGSAINGGAIYGVNTIENSLFTDNKASSGGAASLVGLISNSVFINNHAGSSGGAVSSSQNIINSVFISNTSDGDAGAVEGGNVILNSTFFNNSAKNSGGAISAHLLNIQNSIFYENIADGQPNDLNSFGSGITIDYSLFNHLSGGADVGIHNIITGDPLFLDSANGDYRLQTSSQAINAGDKNVLRKEFSYLFPRIGFNNLVDLDNNPRLKGSGIDMGAFENR